MTFRKVTFPLALPGIFAGTLLTFIPAIGDYVNAELLGQTPSTRMIGNVIQSRFLVNNDYPTASALSLHPDGRHPRRGGGLRPRPRHRGADERGGVGDDRGDPDSHHRADARHGQPARLRAGWAGNAALRLHGRARSST